eukprot:scaffold128374_cov17-Tisochrysis_lutea.AAC.3
MTSKGNVWSLPNMLSIARGLSGPGVAYLILQEQWPWALSALTISGVARKDSHWASVVRSSNVKRCGKSSMMMHVGKHTILRTCACAGPLLLEQELHCTPICVSTNTQTQQQQLQPT